MDFLTFRELVIAYVQVTAQKCGWKVARVDLAKSGSAYVKLRRKGQKCRVRVADHCASGRSDREFFIIHSAVGRIHQLADFLMCGRLGPVGVTEPGVFP